MAEENAEQKKLPQRNYGNVIISLENCIFDKEKLKSTASKIDGLSFETEVNLRILGCEYIQIAGILLRLPQARLCEVAMATGQVLFQRFYYSKSFVKHNMETVAMACINLASKIEEAPRRLRDVINVFHHIKLKNSGKTLEPMVLDAKYITLKNNVIKAERRVLKELGFCVHVKHPHKIALEKIAVGKFMMRNYMNDSLRTDVFVRYSPETIACACIYLSARQLSVVLPSDPDWYGLMNATEEQMQEISLTILKLYTHKRKLYSELEREVERCRATLQAAKMKAKGLLNTEGINSAAGTPTSFSPHSSSAQNSPKVKTESPALPNSYKVGNNTVTEENNGASSVSVKNENGKIPVIKKSSKSRSPSRSVSSGRSSKSSRSRSRSKERDRKSGRSKPKEKRRKRDDSGARHHHSRSRKRKYSHSPSRSRSRSRSRSNSYDRHRKYHRRSPHRDSRSDKHYHRDRSRSRSRSYERVSDKYRKVPKHESSRGKDRR
ncbi:Cyclin-L2 [Holothuria leucospilota]|uniref:Cyclin-L2 n=1 Tax=Holothuria leucospilota TaxID=206669 RepID=A0A9Q1BBJ1_HOLLE|nr:Cyclin-L2 [Holothuria leucospilota]